MEHLPSMYVAAKMCAPKGVHTHCGNNPLKKPHFSVIVLVSLSVLT